MQTQSFVLTIERVKEVIAFPKDGVLYKSLAGIVDCKYQIALGEGKTPEQASRVALDYLGNKMLEMSK